MSILRKTSAAALLTWAAVASAHAQVTVQDPWVRATVPGQPATGLFMTLQTSEPVTLVAARSDVAAIVEVHKMSVENDVMRMREVPALPIEPGQDVTLAPGGYHVMLIDLKRQMEEGDDVPVTLVFETAQGDEKTVDVVAEVRPLGAGGGQHGGGHQADHGSAHGHGKSH